MQENGTNSYNAKVPREAPENILGGLKVSQNQNFQPERNILGRILSDSFGPKNPRYFAYTRAHVDNKEVYMTHHNDQSTLVLDALRRAHPSARTTLELRDATGVENIKGRVSDLRQAGWQIQTLGLGSDGTALYRLTSLQQKTPRVLDWSLEAYSDNKKGTVVRLRSDKDSTMPKEARQSLLAAVQAAITTWEAGQAPEATTEPSEPDMGGFAQFGFGTDHDPTIPPGNDCENEDSIEDYDDLLDW